MKLNTSIFLDGASNTPLDARVLQAMLPYLNEKFVGNSSSTHDHGIRASEAVENSRHKIASIFGVEDDSIIFTSGASESNAMVIEGLGLHELSKPIKQRKMNIVVSAYEHDSILSACKILQSIGFNITYIYPDNKGHITPEIVEKSLKNDTLLVCIMAVNNEIGTMNNIYELGEIIHKNNSLFLCDLTQAISYGGSSLDVTNRYYGADYYSFSGHKIYGPLGVGCLIRINNAPIYGIIAPGAQERGLRGGTSNTPGIVGLGEAIQLISENSYSKHYTALYTYLMSQIQLLPDPLNKIRPTVIPDQLNIVNLNCYPYLPSFQLANSFAMNGISCSAGSACNTTGESIVGSHVLRSIKVPEEEISSCIRLSFTRDTTTQDIDAFLDTLLILYNDNCTMLSNLDSINNEG